MSDYNLDVFRSRSVKAEEDLASASLLLEHDGPPGVVCFPCQQAAEKYLKAFALLNNGPLRKIHDLDRLTKDCIALDAGFGDLILESAMLTKYYMPSRYPDDIPEDVSPEKARAAFDAAVRIKGRVVAGVEKLMKPTGDPQSPQ